MKSKNLSVFFLVAVMLFPIGIHQSYAAITTNEVIITELQFDFIASAEIGSTCLDDANLLYETDGVGGTLGALSSTVTCFEGNTRTWQFFVLNENDDLIVSSTTAVDATATSDMHEVTLTGLEAGTAYRAVLSLTGSYSADPSNLGTNPYTADTSVYRTIAFTTPTVTPTAPVASNDTIEILLGDNDARTVTLPFNVLVQDAEDTFNELTVTFSVLDDADNAQITSYVGTNVTGVGPLGNDEVATVTVSGAELVTIYYGYTGFADTEVVIDYIATDSSGRSDTGMITIKVSRLSLLVANPHTVTLALSDFPTITNTTSASKLPTTIFDGSMVRSPSVFSNPVFSDIGTNDVTLGDSAIGSDSGTLVVTQPSGGLRLVYTPVFGFSGTETFDYTATILGKTASSEFRFIVPVQPVIITANIHTVTLPNLFDLPTINLPISDTVITDTLLAGSTLSGTALESSSLANIIFTTNATGNATGTIAITAATSSTGPIFQYTPPSDSDGNLIVGTEAFAYTATLNGVSGSSTLYIVVPASVCENTMTATFNFGSLSNGVTSDEKFMTMMNTGNVDNQLMIRGDNWKSTADSDIDTMNVGITRYSVTGSDTSLSVREAYDAKTPLTAVAGNLVESESNVAIPVYLQLKIDLLSETFEGATTQVLTISSECN